MRKTISVLMLLSFTVFSALPVAAAPENLFCSLGQDKEKVRHKSGPEVANRVKALQRSNKKVREALALFERNEKTTKRKPRIDDATSVTIDYEKRDSGAVSFLKTSFNNSPQYIGGTVEVISIPTYSADGEWQGTILSYHYDANGNFLAEHISDVMLLPDPTYTYWDAILEVEFTWDGMFIQHGTLALYNQMGTPQGGWPATSRKDSKPQFQNAGFVQGPRFPPRFGIPATPRVKRAVKCVGLGCAGVAVGCAFGSIFFAGAPFAPCATQGCTGVGTVCLLIEVFGT